MSGIADRIRRITTALSRVTLVPFLVRVGVFLSAVLSFALAYPGELFFGRFGGLLLVVAALPAVAPRRVWPTFAALVAVGGWLLSTSGYGEPIALWRLLGLATLLYLGHSLCALAALLPYDGVVAPEVPARWVLRALAVTLAGAVLSVLLMSLAGPDGNDTHLAATLAGLALAVAAAALLGWLLRRP